MTATLYSYLSVVFANLVVRHCKKTCAGCIDNLKVPLNHQCHQLSLLEKYELHFEQMVKKTRFSMRAIMVRYVELMPEFANHLEACITQGMFFLECSTARSLYYGNYIVDESAFNELYASDECEASIAACKKDGKPPKRKKQEY
jgi:hypothetical protein